MRAPNSKRRILWPLLKERMAELAAQGKKAETIDENSDDNNDDWDHDNEQDDDSVRDRKVRGKQIHEPDAELAVSQSDLRKKSLGSSRAMVEFSPSFSGMVSFITQINFRNDSTVHLNHNLVKVKKMNKPVLSRIFNAE
jgi:hypothetical protein